MRKFASACHLYGVTSETLRRSGALHAIENRIGFVEIIDSLGRVDPVLLQELVDIARPRMAAAAIGLPSSRVYPANSPYQVYVDVAAEIAQSHTAVLIVDAYVDGDFFRKYMPNVPPGVKMRILTKGTKKSSFKKLEDEAELIAKSFRASHFLEIRLTEDIHDRHIFIDKRGWVVGQSIKDAGKKSATYVIELPEPDLQELRDADESVWQAATKVV